MFWLAMDWTVKFRFLAGAKIFLFSTVNKTASGVNQAYFHMGIVGPLPGR
jgi:hypothetical protein